MSSTYKDIQDDDDVCEACGNNLIDCTCEEDLEEDLDEDE